MEALVQSLDQLLTSGFPGAKTELELYPDGERVGGYLIWEGFDDFDELDRQRMVSRYLREKLGDEYRSNVATIFAVTPWEVAVMREA